MYRQYGVERDAPTGSLPSHDVQDQLVNAILDEELGRGHLDEAPAQETASEPDLQPDAALPPEDGAQDPADLSSQPKKRGKRIAIIAGIVVAVLALAYGALALLDSGQDFGKCASSQASCRWNAQGGGHYSGGRCRGGV